MESKKRLQNFLDNHRGDGVISHTSMDKGKYFIPEDEMTDFYTLYVEAIKDDARLYLTEKPREIGPLRIDFDFIYCYATFGFCDFSYWQKFETNGQTRTRPHGACVFHH